MVRNISRAQRATWRGRSVVATLGAVLALGVAPVVAAPSAQASIGAPARFVPLPPVRILDTRPDTADAPFNPKGYVNAGQAINVQVAGNGGVPAAATAVAMNVTATAAGGAGFVTVWPAGVEQPTASNLNVERAGQTIPNLVVVQLGSGGAVSMFAQSGAHLIADVAGYWTPATTATGGRFIPAAPTRMMDTREGVGVRFGKLGAGETVKLSLASVEKGPYAAAVLNVTATEANAPGFVTVWPGDGERPNASNLNVVSAGQTIPNLVIVRLGADSSINFYAQQGTHLIADLVGVFTTSAAANNAEGLFLPQSPDRIADSRTPQGFGTVGAGGTATLAIAGGASVGAVLANVTATRSVAPGYVTVWPSATAKPDSSNLNLERAGQTIANLAVSGVGTDGAIALFSQTGTDLIVDVAGAFTKSPSITPVPPPANNGSTLTFKMFLVEPQPIPPSPSEFSLRSGIGHEIDLIQAWLPGQADGRILRMSGPGGGKADVYAQNLSYDASLITPDRLYAEQVASQQLGPNEIGVFWVNAKYRDSCSSNVPRKAIFIFMPGCSGGAGVYPSTTDGSVFPTEASYTLLHEILHGLGAVPACARHYEPSQGQNVGHVGVGGANNDILYERNDRDFTHVGIDPAHTEYYGANIPGCYDLKNDVVWTTLNAAASFGPGTAPGA